MYGSSFHFEQSINTNRLMRTSSTKSERSWVVILIAAILLTISAASYAGPSTPRLPGGNGNVNGR